MGWELTPGWATGIFTVVISAILAPFVKRWWRMIDDATAARLAGESAADHRCDEQIAELRVDYDRRILLLESRLTVMQAGIAELIPLVKDEHQVTALQILWRITGGPSMGVAGD